jgi:hypothetical protein
MRWRKSTIRHLAIAVPVTALVAAVRPGCSLPPEVTPTHSKYGPPTMWSMT